MSYIRVDLDHAPFEGERVVFKAPCSASSTMGLKIYYDGTPTFFELCDAHGVDLDWEYEAFASNALVTVVLDFDVDGNKAFIQNADTNAYLEGRLTKMGSIAFSTSWTGNSSPYTQVVTVTGQMITANSKVDLQPNAYAISRLITDKVSALFISNTDGTLTAYAIGAKPTQAMTVQCSVAEVV